MSESVVPRRRRRRSMLLCCAGRRRRRRRFLSPRDDDDAHAIRIRVRKSDERAHGRAFGREFSQSARKFLRAGTTHPLACNPVLCGRCGAVSERKAHATLRQVRSYVLVHWRKAGSRALRDSMRSTARVCGSGSEIRWEREKCSIYCMFAFLSR